MNWVHWLNLFSGLWAEVMWRAVWQGTLLILAVWALSKLASNVLPAAVRSWLWRIVFLKFCLTLLWVTPLQVPILTVDSHLPQDRLTLPSVIPEFGENPTNLSASETAIIPETARVNRYPSIRVESWLFLIWSSGVLACAGAILRRWREANELVNGARVLPNGPLKHLCEDLARNLPCRQIPALKCSEDIRSPMVLGVWNPVIMLPAAWEEGSPPRHTKMILAHELAHVQRRDLLWVWLSTLAQLLFFFHPLIRWTQRENRLAQEIACDELAILCVHAPPAEYASMLVDVASGVQLPSTTPLAVGVVESYRTLKRRLKEMKHIRSQSKKQLAVAAVLTTLLGAAIIVPWRLVAQNVPPAPPIAPSPAGELPTAPADAAPALAPVENEIPPPGSPAPVRSTGKRKRATAMVAPAVPSTATFSEDGASLVIDDAPQTMPLNVVVHSKARLGQESNDSRDQVLRYKLIFKSGLVQLRHLLNQQSPDEADVEAALKLVGRLERQLVELSDQTDNRDLKSTGNVIREQLTELNAAVGAATSEKTTTLRAKRLMRAEAIVEGLNELVPDIDSLAARQSANPTMPVRITPGPGVMSRFGGSYGSGASGGVGGSTGEFRRQ